jgi:hypothetical protein
MTVRGDGDIPDHVDGRGATRLAGVGQEDSKAGLSEGRIERLPLALLAVAMVLSAWLGLSLNSVMTFYADEWDPLLSRSGWGLDQIFAPFNGHPTMIPMVIYKTVQEVFGMDSARPIQAIHAVLLLLMNGALFLYLRRRVGDWAALIGTVMVLFLGAAFEILLYSFAMNFTGAIAAGIGALVALDRDDRKGDIAASILLLVGVFFSMVIVPFIVAVAAEWALNPRDRRGRIFVPGVSLGVLVVWWLIWGQNSDESTVVASNFLLLPDTAFDAIGSGFTSLFGLATGYGNEPSQPNLIWGKVMAIVAVAIAWWRIKVIGSPPRGFLVVAAGLLTYLLLLGMSLSDERQPTFSRFQLPLVIFILMIASTLLEGIRIGAVWLVTGTVVAALSINAGIGLMRERVEERWEPTGLYVRTWLTGTELAGTDALPARELQLRMPVMVGVGDYLDASERYGSPALNRSEISALEPAELTWVDGGFINASGAGLDADPPASKPSTCRPAAAAPIELKPGRYRVENETKGEVTVLVARLGPTPGTNIGAVLPSSAAGLNLPAGELTEPWRVFFEPGSGRIRLCGP